MISILIPAYNCDITSLINCLSGAISDSEFYSEIVIGADGCDKSYLQTYKDLTELTKVKLHISKDNIGRAAIRNELADKSIGSHLLFIDADALVQPNVKEYLSKYVDYLNSSPVLCGGTAYREVPPDDPDKYLRWHYGFYREQQLARKRNKTAYASFSGFNFIIEKQILSRIKFNSELKKYGHEDTLFGYQLMKAEVPILHIDNPLIHDGLEPNRVFLEKTEEGMQNLSLLYDRVTDRKGFSSSVKLLKTYKRLKLLGMARLLARYYARRSKKIENRLRSHRTSLQIFAVYKLSMFCYFRDQLAQDQA